LRTLFIGVGFFAILLGLANVIIPPRTVYFALSLLIGGVALIIAGLKRYRGEWPTFIGALIVIIGFFVFNTGIDLYLAHNGKHLPTVLSGIFISLIGSLLLCSGHKLHKYSMEIELLRNYQGKTDLDESKPSS
jgi:uncharacterized BrkB/YihY/UPF0761 family membrane protein